MNISCSFSCKGNPSPTWKLVGGGPMRRLFSLVLLVIVGCSPFNPLLPTDYLTVNPHLTTMPTVIVWSDYKSENYGPSYWYKEIASTPGLHQPIIFMCHGCFYNGYWQVCPDAPRKEMRASEVARTLHNLYPTHDIFFIVCNPGHEEMKIDNVWYANRNVWVTPNSAIKPEWQIRWIEHDYVGSVSEFIPPPNRRYPTIERKAR